MEHIAAAPDTDNFAISDFVFFPATEANVAAASMKESNFTQKCRTVVY